MLLRVICKTRGSKKTPRTQYKVQYRAMVLYRQLYLIEILVHDEYDDIEQGYVCDQSLQPTLD